jgi:serine O-acetyltransferase
MSSGEFRAAIRADLARCANLQELSAWGTLAVIRGELGLQALLVYRFGRLLRSCNRRVLAWPVLPLGWLLYAMAAELVRQCYDIRLALSADIGPGFWIGHFGGIKLANCRLGESCTVGQQTRVGRAEDPEGPQIGDGVWVGAHARIYGRVRIGDGATIAPGARVVKDAPGRALIVGDPGRVALRGYDNRTIVRRG